jgi:hypothetical protein
MSKIFEALQYAQTERIQREEIARRPPKETREEVRLPRQGKVSKPVEAKACSCKCQQSTRVARRGTMDFFFRVIGAYPWQCFQCGRRFHRLRRL